MSIARVRLGVTRTPIVRIKPAPDSADPAGVTGFSDTTWLLLAAIAGLGTLQILRALAIRVRNEVAVHDLQRKVAELKAVRVEQLMIRHGLNPHIEHEPDTAMTVDATDLPEPPHTETGDHASEARAAA